MTERSRTITTFRHPVRTISSSDGSSTLLPAQLSFYLKRGGGDGANMINLHGAFARNLESSTLNPTCHPSDPLPPVCLPFGLGFVIVETPALANRVGKSLFLLCYGGQTLGRSDRSSLAKVRCVQSGLSSSTHHRCASEHDDGARHENRKWQLEPGHRNPMWETCMGWLTVIERLDWPLGSGPRYGLFRSDPVSSSIKSPPSPPPWRR